MEWRDQGIVLSLKRHGEYDVIIETLTAAHGRHSGLVKGGTSRKYRGILQPGNELVLHWRARLESHLGTFSLEPHRMRSALLLGEPERLGALVSACALASVALPEREGHGPVYLGLQAFLDALEAADDHWGAVLVRWELGLLQALGFGLDLSACAATGVNDNLIYVSPKSGTAVSREAGAPYKDKLLPLPGFLSGQNIDAHGPADVLAGLELTGYFIECHVLLPQGAKLPAARLRLAASLAQKLTVSSQI
jgi:DNA repair protein RecO (recombination protein O)